MHAFSCKHPTQSIFKMNLLDNKTLLATVAVLTLSAFPVVYIPVINEGACQRLHRAEDST